MFVEQKENTRRLIDPFCVFHFGSEQLLMLLKRAERINSQFALI